jgi:formamidopyrimidine-DNA glycosylase
VIELPEAVTLARQGRQALVSRSVEDLVVLHTPHKWAWFHGDPAAYRGRLVGRTIDGAEAFGGMVELALGEMSLTFYDGANLRLWPRDTPLPDKHQLLLRLDDGTHLVGSVHMYGGFACFPRGSYDNPYYLAARRAPSPLSERFTFDYFSSLLPADAPARLTAKLFLATEQRIPGLGNGVLQDILLGAGIHPRRRMDALDPGGLARLHGSVRDTLARMAAQGGRDTERDLFGQPGGYRSLLCRNTVGTPCPNCGSAILKASYAGGSVYYCPCCQPA